MTWTQPFHIQRLHLDNKHQFDPTTPTPKPGSTVQRTFRDAVFHTLEAYGGGRGCGAALRAGLAAADAATHDQLWAAGVRACAPLAADSAERYSFYARGALA